MESEPCKEVSRLLPVFPGILAVPGRLEVSVSAMTMSDCGTRGTAKW